MSARTMFKSFNGVLAALVTRDCVFDAQAPSDRSKEIAISLIARISDSSWCMSIMCIRKAKARLYRPARFLRQGTDCTDFVTKSRCSVHPFKQAFQTPVWHLSSPRR